ncbi:MAG: ATP-binding protein [Planctomycetota bacterium]
MVSSFPNPFRPGAGHPPPYLAGRDHEKREFAKLLAQRPVMTNLVLTGLRGVGKTVLLETLKPIALQSRWMWAGADLSESATVSEESIAVRILADLAPLVANVVVDEQESRRIGFAAESRKTPVRLEFGILKAVFDDTPGLVADKLKAALELVWASLRHTDVDGIVLAYDEAQNLADQAADQQYPLSLLLDVFQSIQKRGLPILLVLTGLPTLFPKLVAARTFAERMFRVSMLEQLSDAESREAIIRPTKEHGCPVKFTAATVGRIIEHSGGYPYFIQFLCRELFDSYVQQRAQGTTRVEVTIARAVTKLDSDFFAGRWNRVTDRQRELLALVAQLPDCDDEFTVLQIVAKSRQALAKPFSASHVTQILAKLGENGLVYKNRRGRYSFAVPLLGGFIRRQEAPPERA